jgi:6-phosphogluconolactonase/glucosamine-6-phosphate isomerase/deaminase
MVSDSKFKIQNSEPGQAGAEPKLEVTVATKIDEDRARRFQHIALASGMTVSELFRLLLHRADILFEHWDERINPKFFIDQFVLREGQLTLFDFSQRGKSRLRS